MKDLKNIYQETIALTGPSGSGKSTLARIIQGMGIEVISADSIAKEILEPGSVGYNQVVKNFGNSILDVAVIHEESISSEISNIYSSPINRKKLRDIVFNDPVKRKLLEDTTHPFIRDKARDYLSLSYEKTGNPPWYDVPLFYETGMEALGFKKVVYITSSRQILLERISKRDEISISEAELRLNAQLQDSEKRKRADFIIENNGSIQDLEVKARILLSIINEQSL
ncbi:MAG TPA: dephospho-CoA kinase [Oligoflexia bacterium]|nr:dephospho-CoA kinase [Oligoflexia bacterium]HMP47667.1 dephospho-CoA kinase [Oligoflexia bacterium]